ncbi:hypothetical protein P154DRAFT_518391 [Amniculicola lignicola CBS 123094]|uniref:Uncharacterized protein n=1 Tax=Amniculicola lignicola CBS 123094 TaxID=1392246 RepID=A0A6A5WZM6_9PLEO|nr:hypothetical protein P154DRAFT_518391 [Amniculicola lignicola CBS 123094]
MSQYPIIHTARSHLSRSINAPIIIRASRHLSSRCRFFPTTTTTVSRTPCSSRPRAPFISHPPQRAPFIAQPRPQHRSLSTQSALCSTQSTALLPTPIYTSPNTPPLNLDFGESLLYQHLKKGVKAIGWWGIKRLALNLIIDGLLLHALMQETEEEKLEAQRVSHERRVERSRKEQENRREYGVWLGRMNGIEDWEEGTDYEEEKGDREYL